MLSCAHLVVVRSQCCPEGHGLTSPGNSKTSLSLGSLQDLWRFRGIEAGGRFRLKVIWVCAGLAGLVCFTTDQDVFCHCCAGRSQMPQAWDLAGFISTPWVVRLRLSLNCRMHFTVQQKCLGFMMCGAFFYHYCWVFFLI